MSDGRSLQVTRWFEDEPDTVFDAFRAAGEWWCPTHCALAGATIDFRVGGSYRFEMLSPDSTEPIVVHGRYTAVERPERLAFTQVFDEHPLWDGLDLAGHETLVTVHFAALDGGTEVSLVEQRLPNQAAADRLTPGYGSILSGLELHLDRRRRAASGTTTSPRRGQGS